LDDGVMLDINHIREQFPALTTNNATRSLVYLDSAATTQKPQCVIDALTDYYRFANANVHRGSHQLTAKSTSNFESARQTVAQFIGAASGSEVIWTRGATESINLVAQSYARTQLTSGDEILVSETEHHANIVPWQLVAMQTGAKVVKIPMTADAQFNLEAFHQLLSPRTKLVAIAHITNVTGSRQPIEEVIQFSHKNGAVVLVDAAQGIVHEPINVKNLDADFLVFSGHKLYGPTGIGVLYGKQSLLETMPPWQGGGKMVTSVSFDTTTYAELPAKFEAGTPNISGALALAAAINWYKTFDRNEIEAHLHSLQQNMAQQISKLNGVRLIGYQTNSSLISFVIDGVHHQDLATLLDQQGIAIRAGHHCAHPFMAKLGLTGTIRISLGIYNDEHDVSLFITALEKAVDML
jgi:cysteine sulfinate desulfinase